MGLGMPWGGPGVVPGVILRTGGGHFSGLEGSADVRSSSISLALIPSSYFVCVLSLLMSPALPMPPSRVTFRHGPPLGSFESHFPAHILSSRASRLDFYHPVMNFTVPALVL